jgi:hypothetical protein
MLKAVKPRPLDPMPGLPVPSPYPYPPPSGPTPYPPTTVPAFPSNPAAPAMGMPLHACMGLNSCAGCDRFGPAGPPGGQPNACAGQGYCSNAVDHTCHVQNACQGQGGCGLYGTGEEMNNPGANACQSLGSCATPINAERFSTNGPNQGLSVWVRARQVFQQNWPQIRQQLQQQQATYQIATNQPLPATLGQPPAAFATTGPTYLWISDDNQERVNMTACGASGLSGAGGCS